MAEVGREKIEGLDLKFEVSKYGLRNAHFLFFLALITIVVKIAVS